MRLILLVKNELHIPANFKIENKNCLPSKQVTNSK